MDFSRLSHLRFDTHNHNETLTSLPSAFLEALIPGYGVVSMIVFRIFGFDIGLVVSGCLVLFGLTRGSQFFYGKAYGLFYYYFMSTIQVEDDDELFGQIMEWIAEQNMTKRSRDLKAVTKWVSAYDDGEEEGKANDDDVLDESGIFNFEKWASNIPPRYEPNFGSDKFYHEGRVFRFTRTRREKKRSYWGEGEDQVLDISCVGRSTEPIKELLNYIKKWNLNKDNKSTTIFRPAPKEDRKDYAWDRQSCRPSRPMSTVSLDTAQKSKIVMDINEYLHPASARWYAARGIPYRRGYLFYGPPGTGKTSLSFALAGIFGLDIYCISLMEVGLSESDLNKLFAHLPRRCIVLLEDIDSAGLRRPDEPATDAKDTASSTASDAGTDDGLTKISKADAIPGSLKPATVATSGGFKSLISLSGLLNAIDGVASHEGRVLIMTTNCPEKLDAALIRPGRVDLQVQFTLATKDQTRDIFKRMYSSSADAKSSLPCLPASEKRPSSSSSTSTSTSTSKTNPPTKANEDYDILSLLSQVPNLDILEPEELQSMADQFAAEVPENAFSPAEIQGFLLMRKKEPRRALLEVKGWREELVEAKKRERKVLSVQ
ncbi:P-loop containing nucleoside triphosphate hydrolase protein [Amniculicola lignicola CBS 123094]|uniref:P-loop containing nucleoside triphosphate hydrolase protein n=1 Tax=Amniculicola lignicola CBS 123094 TaxID=1392246 RepID=A0A6A5WB90_9PLEO|nr:P-loop containing nucleoside triphosphate hydrolase protein [Amniculicola lignicola CBS 123094]